MQLSVAHIHLFPLILEVALFSTNVRITQMRGHILDLSSSVIFSLDRMKNAYTYLL